MQIQGKLIQSTKVEQITDTFKKCNIILQTDGDTQYPQEVSIEVHNANIDKLKGLAKDDVVTVDVNLRGRRYDKEGQEPRWFNSLVMWKIEKTGTATAADPSAPPVAAAPTPAQDDDDLPF